MLALALVLTDVVCSLRPLHLGSVSRACVPQLSAKAPLPAPLQRLDEVLVEVTASSPAGAFVREIARDTTSRELEPTPPDVAYEGSVRNEEMDRFSSAALTPGDLLRGFALRPATEQRRALNVCFDPFGPQWLIIGCQALLIAARRGGGRIGIGLGSSAEEIAPLMAGEGMSKTQLRACASRLYRLDLLEKPVNDATELQHVGAADVWPDTVPLPPYLHLLFDQVQEEAGGGEDGQRQGEMREMVQEEAVQLAHTAQMAAAAEATKKLEVLSSEVFVAGFPSAMSAIDLLRLLSAFGLVRCVRGVSDVADGGAAGAPHAPHAPHAWVRFETAVQARAAVEASPLTLNDGSTLRVKPPGDMEAVQAAVQAAARRMVEAQLPRGDGGGRREGRRPAPNVGRGSGRGSRGGRGGRGGGRSRGEIGRAPRVVVYPVRCNQSNRAQHTLPHSLSPAPGLTITLA